MISFHILVATLACAVTLVQYASHFLSRYLSTNFIISASWSFEGETCNQAKKDILTEEISNAFYMAAETSAHFSDYDKPDPQNLRQYYYDFFRDKEREDPAKPFPVMYNIYKNIGLMLDTAPPNPGYKFTITCDDTTESCTKKNLLLT